MRYRVVNPQNAIISGGIDIWLVTGIMGLLTVVFLLIPLVTVWRALQGGEYAANAAINM